MPAASGTADSVYATGAATADPLPAAPLASSICPREARPPEAPTIVISIVLATCDADLGAIAVPLNTILEPCSYTARSVVIVTGSAEAAGGGRARAGAAAAGPPSALPPPSGPACGSTLNDVSACTPVSETRTTYSPSRSVPLAMRYSYENDPSPAGRTVASCFTRLTATLPSDSTSTWRSSRSSANDHLSPRLPLMATVSPGAYAALSVRTAAVAARR